MQTSLVNMAEWVYDYHDYVIAKYTQLNIWYERFTSF